MPAVGATESLRDHTTTVAFTEAGEPLWRRPGIDLTRVPDLAPTGPDSSSNPLVAVEYTGGTATFKGMDASPRTTVRDVSIALVRLDPASGRNLWRVDLGRQALTTLADGLPLELTPTGLSAQSEKSPVVVDLASGSSRPAAAATVTWRRESVRYTGLVPYDSPAGALLERHGEVWQPRRQGQPIADLGSLGGPLPDAVGEQFGPRLVSLSESVVAVRTG